MQRWLGGPPPSGAGLKVDTQLDWNGQRWEVHVSVSFAGHSGSRDVAVSNCAEAADFVAVAIVLAIDPSLAPNLDLQRAEPEPDADFDTAGSKGNSAEAPSSPEPSETSEEAEQAVLLRPESASFGKKKKGFDPPPDSSPPVRVRPHAMLLAVGGTGALPGLRFGVAGAVGASVARLDVALGAKWLPPRATPLGEGTPPVDLSLLTSRLSATYWLLGPRFFLGPELALQLGATRAQQESGSFGTVNEPWVAVDVGTRAALELLPFSSVVLGLSFEVPLTTPRFVLTDDTLVHRATVGVAAELGLRFFFLPQ